MTVLSILKDKFIGTTMPLYKDDDNYGMVTHHKNDDRIEFNAKIVDVVYVDIVVDCSDVFQSYDYFKLVFDCGYELELEMN
jgi:hypothetical protein